MRHRRIRGVNCVKRQRVVTDANNRFGTMTAVVIGGGIAGLVSASVLSKAFDSVYVVDKDDLLGGDVFRPGVPQGPHLHVLLRRGLSLLAQMMPEFLDELHKAGLASFDFSLDHKFYQGGQWKVRHSSKFKVYPQSRPHFEMLIRTLLGKVRNVKWIAAQARDVTFEGDAVTGVIISDSGRDSTLPADLVIDAMGRSSRLPSWLEANGFRRPSESKLKIELRYASTRFENPQGVFDWTALSIYPEPPKIICGGAIQPTEEGGVWIASLFGYHGHYPPLDQKGFIDFASRLPQDDLRAVIDGADFKGKIHGFGYPAQRWLHYERQSRHPRGLLPIGDSYCNFDPAFGQGMAVAISQAFVLKILLEKGGVEGVIRSPKKYLSECAKFLRIPWLLTTGDSQLHPQLQSNSVPIAEALCNSLMGSLCRLNSDNEWGP